MHKVLTYTIGLAAVIANYATAAFLYLLYFQLFGSKRGEATDPALAVGIMAALALSPVLLWLGRRAHRRGLVVMSYLALAVVATPGLGLFAGIILKRLQSGP